VELSLLSIRYDAVLNSMIVYIFIPDRCRSGRGDGVFCICDKYVCGSFTMLPERFTKQ